MPLDKQVFTGPARVFDNEEACFEAVKNRQYAEGDVLVIRYEGPKGGPGMREMLSTTAALYGQGMGDKVALITDGRFSARPAASASAMSGRRRRSAGRSACSRTATSSISTRSRASCQSTCRTTS